MEITKDTGRIILEMIGHVRHCAGNTPPEDDLENEIKNNFPELEDYDYLEEKRKNGW